MLARSIGLVAAAGVVCAAAIIPAVPAEASSGHVGIVVSTGLSTVTKCVSAGGTGLDVLKRGFPDTDIGSSGPYAGFVLSINGFPKNRPPDSSHYWSYWHSSGNGSWTYSSSGAGSYTPKPGTVDGWSYVNDKPSATRPPKISYTKICGATKPKPTHSTTPKPTARPITHASTHATSHASTHATTHAAAAHAPQKPTHHATPTSTASTPTQSAAPTASTSSASSSALASPTTSPLAAHTRSKSSSFPAWGTIVAVIVVLALGSAAWLRLRRRPE